MSLTAALNSEDSSSSSSNSSMEAPRWQHPYTVQLDPDTARTLATNGATILLLDVPEATPIGLDQQVWMCKCSRPVLLLPFNMLLLGVGCPRQVSTTELQWKLLTTGQGSQTLILTEAAAASTDMDACTTPLYWHPSATPTPLGRSSYPRTITYNHHRHHNHNFTPAGVPDRPTVQGHQDVAPRRSLPVFPGPQYSRWHPQPPSQHLPAAKTQAGLCETLGPCQRGFSRAG